MIARNVYDTLSGNPYPGRGIMLGLSSDGGSAVIAYFIMGRSENSRNRVFVECGDGIRTQAFDPARLADPSLIIYAPVRTLGNAYTIVTNGDQTDTVFEHMQRGGSFEDALRTRTFEPDAPNYTPRISGLMHVELGRASFMLSILKASDGDPQSPQRFFFDYPAPRAGEGRLIHTYLTDGDPIPSFEGEPTRVTLSGSIDELTDGLWSALDESNKVSLFTRYINLKTGAAETRIINKNRR